MLEPVLEDRLRDGGHPVHSRRERHPLRLHVRRETRKRLRLDVDRAEPRAAASPTTSRSAGPLSRRSRGSDFRIETIVSADVSPENGGRPASISKRIAPVCFISGANIIPHVQVLCDMLPEEFDALEAAYAPLAAKKALMRIIPDNQFPELAAYYSSLR